MSWFGGNWWASKWFRDAHARGLAEAFVYAVGISGPSELLRQPLIEFGAKVPEGRIVIASLVPYAALLRAIEENLSFLLQFDWRRFEELTAALLRDEGFDEVILTPPSGDGGRDVIAVLHHGDYRFKVFGQAKRYGPPNHRVSADEVRAFCHVIDDDVSVSKGIITTTSSFAPGVRNEFASRIPTRLELQDGVALRERIRKLAGL
ncbi:MAG TPA: restriction endonuclease [Planctomycetaceae bacterium]|nr:restriction endonuclease [Planctomycetaceae bacterium]